MAINKLIRPIAVAVLLMLTGIAQATTYYSRSSGNWNNTSTWSTTGFNGSAASSYPGQLGAGDIVFISNETVTVNVTPAYSVGTIYLNQNNGNDHTRLYLTVAGVTLTCTGISMVEENDNKHMEIEVASTARLQVNGDVGITRSTSNTRSKRMRVLIKDNAEMYVTGDFTYTFGRAAGSHGEREVYLQDNGLLDIGGAFTVTHGYTRGSGNRFNWDMEDNSVFNSASVSIVISNSDDGDDVYIDLDGGTVTTGPWIATVASTATSGNKIEFDNDGASVTTGDMTLNQFGGSSGEIWFDYANSSANSPATLIVNGTFTYNSSNGDDFDFDTDQNSVVDIRGDLTVVVAPSSSSDDFVFTVDQGEFTVDGVFTAIAYDNNDVEMEIDGSVMITEGIVFDQRGGSDGDMHIKINRNSTAEPASLTIGSNGIAFLDGGGDDIDLHVYPNGSLIVNGDMDFSLNAGSGNDRIRFLLENGSGTPPSAVINGDVIATVNSGTNSADQIFFDIDAGSLTVNGDMTLTTAATANGGSNTRVEVDGNGSSLTVTGTLSLNRLGGTGDDYVDIGTNNGSPVVTLGSLVLNHQVGDETRFKVNNSSIVTVLGDITFQASGAGGAWIDLNENAELRIGGNFVRAASPNRFGRLAASSNTWVRYIGSAQQIVAGDAGDDGDDFDYENVEINNTATSIPQVLMTAAEGDATITSGNELLLTSGVVQSDANAKFLINNNATSNEGNAGSYIDGPMTKIGNSPNAFVFPVGDGQKWARLGVSNYTGYNSSTRFTAQYYQAPAPNNTDMATTGEQLNHVSKVEYWNLARDFDPGNNASSMVTLHWEDQTASGIAEASELRVAVQNAAAKWESYGQGAISFGSIGSIRSGSPVGSFGNLTFGTTGGGNSLPVELVSFDAVQAGQVVDLSWSTASEINSELFEVQRAANGQDFETIATVNARGTTTELTQYSAVDWHPVAGTNYYRLHQVDLDGSFSNSNIAVVEFESATGISVQVFPNPIVNGNIHVQANSTITDVSLYDHIGNVVMQREVESVSSAALNVDGLAKGVYVMTVNSLDGAQSFKLIKE